MSASFSYYFQRQELSLLPSFLIILSSVRCNEPFTSQTVIKPTAKCCLQPRRPPIWTGPTNKSNVFIQISFVIRGLESGGLYLEGVALTNDLQQTLEHGLLKANVSNKNLHPSDSNKFAAAFQTVQQPKPAIPVLPLPLEIINNNNGQIGSNYRHSVIKRKIHLRPPLKIWIL